MKKLILLIVLLLQTIAAICSSGWTKDKNATFVKLSQNYIGGSTFFGPDGKQVSITTIRYFNTNLYAEYGITNRLTTIVYIPFFVRNTLNAVELKQSGKREEGDELNSIGDADLALKYGLIFNKPTVLSATLLVGLPLGKNAGGESGILQTGDGEFNQLIQLDISHSFYPKKYYLSANVGFNNRTRGFSDEFRFGAEVGFLLNKFTPILKINSIFSFYNGDGNNVQNALFSNNTEYISPTVELNYMLKNKIGVSVSGGFAPYAKNIIASPNWGLGIFLKL